MCSMKCPYETLLKSGWIFNDICNIYFKQYDGLWYHKGMRVLLATVELPKYHCLPSSPSLGTPCCPSLPWVSSTMKANVFFFGELVLNACMITSSWHWGKRQSGSCHLGVPPNSHDLCTRILQFSKEVYPFYRQPCWHRPGWAVGDSYLFLPASFWAPQLNGNGSEKPLWGLLWGCCLETGNLKTYQVKPAEEGSTALQLILLFSTHNWWAKAWGKYRGGGSCVGCQLCWQSLSQNYLQQWALGFPPAHFLPVT